MSKNERKYPKGYWMSIGISIGVAIGVAMGPIYDNFGVGIGIGVPGRPAATARADFGRWPGSFCRQRRIARSTAGSRSSTSVDGCVGEVSSCERITS